MRVDVRVQSSPRPQRDGSEGTDGARVCCVFHFLWLAQDHARAGTGGPA